MEIRHYPESWKSLAEIGRPHPYQPTFVLDATMEQGVRRYLEAPCEGWSINIGVRGRLHPVDAAKLYELAYTSPGDILELGSGYGLSGSILTEAILDAGSGVQLVSVDISADKTAFARRNLKELGRADVVEFMTGEAAEVCRRLAAAKRPFSLVFVDHSHSYEAVLAVCEVLPALVTDGGFVLFHDFNDRRNRSANVADYGVYQAVLDRLPPTFTFSGIFGCCGLYQHHGLPQNLDLELPQGLTGAGVG